MKDILKGIIYSIFVSVIVLGLFYVLTELDTIDSNIGMYCLMVIFPVVSLILSIYLRFQYGPNEKIVETIEFYPPEGLNSLEVGYIYNGKATSTDVMSLLIYLADKGYIKISETEKSKKEKSVKIIKLKEYDGCNINEKLFIDGLFKDYPKDEEETKKKGFFAKIFKKNLEDEDVEQVKNPNEVLLDDLKDNFYTTVYRILNNINSKGNKKKIFDTSTLPPKIMIGGLIVGNYYIVTIPLISKVLPPPTNWFLAIFAATILGSAYGLAIFFYIVMIKIRFPKLTDSNWISKLYGSLAVVIFPIAFIILLATTFFFILTSITPITVSIYIIAVICIAGMSICLKHLTKRTIYGKEMLTKVMGFRRFLETAEKEKLEALVLENPSYFYNILPYSYTLRVSSKWIEKFEVISVSEPDWYDSTDSFDITTFESSFSETMDLANSSMLSDPFASTSDGGSYSSGDSSGGGGSSGGGSGGGGGGAW